MTDKTIVLITGANRGIGYATVEELLRSTEGGPYHVLLTSRDRAKGDAAVSALQPVARHDNSVSALELDITSSASIAKAVEEVSQQFGRLDILVNNAGADFKVEDRVQKLRDTLEINLVGPFAVTLGFKDLLRKQRTSGPAKQKRLIHVSSSLGSITWMRNSPGWKVSNNLAPEYSISKAGMSMMSALDEQEMKDVKVFCFNPKFAITELGGAETVPFRKENGAITAAEAGQACVEVIRGDRDGDAGLMVEQGGTIPW